MSTSTRRLTAFMYMLWFALYVGVPQFVHPCPEHNATAAASATIAESGDDGAGHHAHHSGVPASDESSTGDCCCPGPHCGTMAMDLGSARPTAFPPTVALHLAPSVASTLAPASRVAHALPFATAPPSWFA